MEFPVLLMLAFQNPLEQLQHHSYLSLLLAPIIEMVFVPVSVGNLLRHDVLNYLNTYMIETHRENEEWANELSSF